MNYAINRLIPLFCFLSGFVSLGLQIAWNRILGQEVGVDYISSTIIISIFMLGLGCGGLIGGKLTKLNFNILRLSFLIEMLISCMGFFSEQMLRKTQNISALFSGYLYFGNSYFADFWAVFVILSIPTFLMGISLPIFAHARRQLGGAGETVGFIYSMNILGATIGTFVVGYFGLGNLGISNTCISLSFLNLVWSLTGFVLAGKFKFNLDSSGEKIKSSNSYSKNFAMRILFVAFGIGFISLAYEIVYFRIFVYYFTASSYVFPTILGSYLIHLAIGNYSVSQLLKYGTSRVTLLKASTFGTIITSSWVFIIAWLVDPSKYQITQLSTWNDLYSSFLLAFLMMTPVLFLSAFFPLLVDFLTDKEASLGFWVGKVYFYQTIGNFVGVLTTGFLLLPILGTPLTVLIFVLFLFLLLVVTIHLLKRLPSSAYLGGSLKFPLKSDVVWLLLCVIFLIPINSSFFSNFKYRDTVPRISEQPEGTAFIYDHPAGGARISIGSEPATSYNSFDKYDGVGAHDIWPLPLAMKLRGYKPPKKILIVGIGTASFSIALKALFPDAEITIVELLQIVIDEMLEKGSPATKAVLNSSKVVVTDGRRFLNRANNHEKYDLIQVGVFHVVSAGSGNLFTSELLEKMSTMLSDDGLLTFNAYINPIKSSLDQFDQIAIFGRGHQKVSDVFLGNGRTFETIDENSFLESYSWARNQALNNGTLDILRLVPPGENPFVFFDKEKIRSIVNKFNKQTDDYVASEFYLNNLTVLDLDPRYWPLESSDIKFNISPQIGRNSNQ